MSQIVDMLPKEENPAAELYAELQRVLNEKSVGVDPVLVMGILSGFCVDIRMNMRFAEAQRDMALAARAKIEADKISIQ